MLSFHLFFCLPLLLASITIPCRIVFAMSEDLEMWQFPFLHHYKGIIMYSDCILGSAANILVRQMDCRKCSEVSYSISYKWLGSFFRVLLSRSSSHRRKGRWIRWFFYIVSRWSTRTSASSSSSAFKTMSSTMWKLVISRPPMLTLPS